MLPDIKMSLHWLDKLFVAYGCFCLRLALIVHGHEISDCLWNLEGDGFKEGRVGDLDIKILVSRATFLSWFYFLLPFNLHFTQEPGALPLLQRRDFWSNWKWTKGHSLNFCSNVFSPISVAVLGNYMVTPSIFFMEVHDGGSGPGTREDS